jgi:SAM-dependent methyltransferase
MSEHWRVGHSGTSLPLAEHWRVLDVGSGDNPHPRADVLLDRFLDRSIHRSGQKARLDGRPLVVGDASALPFRDCSFDFVIASHVVEHVDRPEQVCGELMRVAHAGYVEAPGPLSDALLGEPSHKWSVRQTAAALAFTPFRWPSSASLHALSVLVYGIFYLGTERSRWTLRPRLLQLPVLGSPFWRVSGLLQGLWAMEWLRDIAFTRFTFGMTARVDVDGRTWDLERGK